MAGYYGKNYEKPDDALVESSQESSTPAVDYSDSPFYEGNTDSNSDIVEDDDEEKKKEETTAEPAAPQGEVETAKAANNGQSYTETAVANVTGQQTPQYDPVAAMKNDGLSDDTQNALSTLFAASNNQNFSKTLETIRDQRPDLYNAYIKYYSQPPTPTAATPAPQAPQQAATQNSILPSAGGNYQADRIYDPSKTYGRQADGSYVFSNSARELQNNLAREGYYKGAIDGYFGQQTQEALNAYLAEHGIKAEPDKGSDALTQAVVEAPKAETPSNVDQAVQNTTGTTTTTNNSGNGKSGKTDNSGTDYDSMLQDKAKQREAAEQAWYDKEFEKYYGSPPNKDILDDRRIREYVDEMRAKEGMNAATAEDEINDEQLRLAALERQAEEQARLDEMNAKRDEKFGQDFVNDLKANEGDVSRIIAKGDKSYNSWIQDNWDDLAYTYNLGNQSPFGNQSSSSEVTVYDSPIGPTMPEPSGVYGTSGYRGVPNRYQAELEQMQESGGQVYGTPRNGSVPERYIPEAEPQRQSMAGNSMSAALENYRPDEQARQHFQDNYDFLYNSGGQVKDGVTLGLGKTYWKDAEPTRDDQYYESLYRSGETPASLYQRHEGNDNAYKYSQDYENWLADRGLTDYGYGVAESWRHGGEMNISENSPGARSGAYAEANRPEVHYGDTRSTTFEDADQLALYDELENLYRSSVADPHATGTSEAMASDDIQSSSSETASSDEQAMRDAYEAAMQSAERARDIFQGLPTNEAEQMQQAREQWQQNMRTALEDQFNNPYMQQFRQDFNALQRQFPNYSYSALADMVLFNEEMRNGQSSYYKWLADTL